MLSGTKLRFNNQIEGQTDDLNTCMTRCVCETGIPPVAIKSKLVIFSIKVTAKVTVITNYFYDTSVIFSNFIITYRESFTGST